jgi:chemotaxis protein methyltransferase CheR
MTDAECVAFLQSVLPRLRLEWSGFRTVRGQVCKRLSRRLRELALDDLAAYRAYLDAHPEEWETLDGLCRITISRFFRDRRVFQALAERGLPELAWRALERGNHRVRCWSAGCASGEEPYTVSIAWEMEAARRPRGVELEIVATDVDLRLLERARRARYRRGSIKEVPQGWIDEAFVPEGEEIRLGAAFRRRVKFILQDIREGMPPGPFDLLLCRNLVFTYFEPSLREEVLGRMLELIPDGGLLVLGSHETVPAGREWPLERPFGGLPIYRRIGVEARGATDRWGRGGVSGASIPSRGNPERPRRRAKADHQLGGRFLAGAARDRAPVSRGGSRGRLPGPWGSS